MERSILVAVAPDHDPSGLVARAAAWACRLNTRLDVASVVQGPPDEEAGRGCTAVGTWLDSVMLEIPDAVRGRRHVLSGPDIVAALAAHSVTYDILAVGTHHRTATGRLFLGSIAEGMMRYAPVPVLVLPPGGQPVVVGDPPRIRLPVDINEPNLAGVAWVAQNCPDADAVAVYALPWAQVMGPGPRRGDSIYERAHDALSEALSAEGHDKLDRFVLVREEMNPGEAIAHDAYEADVELLVVPTRGRTGLSRLIIGSVAERLVRAASQDVLVVR